MPKFLNERQIGMDPAKIGFPNLGDCMAMVLLDEGGLFGFHLTAGDLSNAPRFVQYVQAHRNYTGNLTIYVEFRVVGSVCSVWYKRMSKIATDPGDMTAPDDDIRELAPDLDVKRALFAAGRDAEWDSSNPVRKASTNLGRGDTRDAHLAKATRGNKGELHAVKSLIEFTV